VATRLDSAAVADPFRVLARLVGNGVSARVSKRLDDLGVVGLLQIGRSETPCEQQAVAFADRLAEAASRAPEADQLARGLGLLLGLDDHPIEVSGVRSGSIPRRVKPAGVTREVMDAWPFLRDG
jgi:hypothetical protein